MDRKRVAVVTGGSSGLGAAVCRQLCAGEHMQVISLDRQVTVPILQTFPGFVSKLCDVGDKESVRQVADEIGEFVDVLVHCAGVNEINYLQDLVSEDWDRVMGTNAKGIYFVMKYLLPALIRTKAVVCIVSSNASHVPMTASLVYNASKAAAHIMTLQLARELTPRYGITVFGVAPNKMHGTAMSRYIEQRVLQVRGWSESYAVEYQKQALLTGVETDPEMVAELIVFLTSSPARYQSLSGCVLPYGA